MRIHISEEGLSNEAEREHRRIQTSSSAFGILREQLLENIGIDRIRGFLFHFGWEMGVNDAKEAMQSGMPLDELIKYGPILHAKSGQIRGFKHECSVVREEEGRLVSVLGQGVWLDSYEAAEHLKRHGVSTAPVCHTLIGYSSGFMTTIFGQPLLAREISCVGKGDAECRWVIKLEREWAEQEIREERLEYAHTPIVKELEYTYDQLLEQKNIVTRMADFHHKLTEAVIGGIDLAAMVERVYRMLGIPVAMTDGFGKRIVASSGLPDEAVAELEKQLRQAVKEHSPFGRKAIRTTDGKELLIASIPVQKEIMGYCAFLYEDGIRSKRSEDDLLLDRFVSAASLILLNEKTRFDSFERMKGNFLDQLLDGKLPESEIVQRGAYAGLDLRLPYEIVVMDYAKAKLTLEEEFRQQELLYEAAVRYFKSKHRSVLIGHRNGRMVLLFTLGADQQSSAELLKPFQQELARLYPQGDYRFGISGVGDDIGSASKRYEEASVALRLARRKAIVPFRSLGIFGLLIDNRNEREIGMIVKRELGSLYNLQDPKSVELLLTLHSYLLNGGKLEQTMSDLSLSMSGLRHRIARIEEKLQKDLRNPTEMHQLWLILNYLIAVGELQVE
ncbi:XylR N-terminal domain-containing protein [Cohnella sp. AR92]|uniref:XylR N-terminal domain-containing protein n=1 Tax=Cohnella sp. AR92 TaxID=648716 RepID=UPI000F8CDBAC|nr:XylR N-terminal domain-containing protein [Cohnella sp. AR92]RUS43909.1 PucR family transcriptional regulator [Cohnella sp. AR92]